MEDFDLETAIALLPVMTGQEQDTKSLIDSIEFYSEMIFEDSKQFLINFVLKTRLTRSAKFCLNRHYADVDSLLRDMREFLVTKECPVALKNKLLNCKQRNRLINAFGSEIAGILTELTLAQSDGNQEKVKILHPVNEKLAVNVFAKGLNSSRIGTIISCRQVKSLSEAIQLALDEEAIMSSFENSYQVNSFHKSYSNRLGQRYYNISRKNYINTNERNYKDQQLLCNVPLSTQQIPSSAYVLRDQQTQRIVPRTLNNSNNSEVVKFDMVFFPNNISQLNCTSNKQNSSSIDLNVSKEEGNFVLQRDRGNVGSVFTEDKKSKCVTSNMTMLCFNTPRLGQPETVRKVEKSKEIKDLIIKEECKKSDKFMDFKKKLSSKTKKCVDVSKEQNVRKYICLMKDKNDVKVMKGDDVKIKRGDDVKQICDRKKLKKCVMKIDNEINEMKRDVDVKEKCNYINKESCDKRRRELREMLKDFLLKRNDENIKVQENYIKYKTKGLSCMTPTIDSQDKDIVCKTRCILKICKDNDLNNFKRIFCISPKKDYYKILYDKRSVGIT